MNTKILIIGALTAVSLAGCATKDEATYRAEADTALKRDFHARGIATMDRLQQDEVQRLCTQYRDNPPFEMQQRLEAMEQKTIKLPADGKYMGDWKNGARIAESGRGMTWSDPPGNNGGSCYNCHQLSPQQTSFGTLGPSLLQFGKARGYTLENQKYVYERIYNSKAFNTCSTMPRFGSSGTLTENQIKDLVAYLMDPNSPVNK